MHDGLASLRSPDDLPGVEEASRPRFGAEISEQTGVGIGSAQPGHLVAGLQEAGDDSPAENTRRSGEEDLHDRSPESSLSMVSAILNREGAVTA
jgi:hypothetical protein